MSDEVRTLVATEQLRNVVGVGIEVHPAIGRRRAAEAAAVDDQEPVPICERTLRAPRLLSPAEAAVHEHSGLAVAPGCDVEVAHERATLQSSRGSRPRVSR